MALVTAPAKDRPARALVPVVALAELRDKGRKVVKVGGK